MDKMNQFISMALMALLISACNPLQTKSNFTKFEDTFTLYSKHLRWGHFRQITHFMTPEHQATSVGKIASYKNRRVSNVEPLGWTVLDEGTKIIGDIQIQYYLTEQGVIRTTTQTQEWLYQNEHWVLNSPLPTL